MWRLQSAGGGPGGRECSERRIASICPGGPGDRLGTVSHGAPEPWPRLPTGQAQALKQNEPLPHPHLCDLMAAAVSIGHSLRDLAPLG